VSHVSTPELLTREQLRDVVKGYLDELLGYYAEQQRRVPPAHKTSSNKPEGACEPACHPKLEQRVVEMFWAVSTPDPIRRREAVLEVLLRAKPRSEA